MADYVSYSEDQENTFGALIFLGYIVAALYLSAKIVSLLRHHYALVPMSQHKHAKIVLFSILTLLSFVTLSYHMLSFLILSYTDYCARHRLAASLHDLHLWQWMSHATLFTDFAQALVASPQRWWWVQLALLQTMDTACWMAQNGNIAS